MSSVSSDDDCDMVCSQCMLPTDDGNSRFIKCDACLSAFHQHCTNMSIRVFDTFMKIKLDVGWVCADCRDILRVRGENLQSTMVTLSEEVAAVKCQLSDVKEQLFTVVSAHSKNQVSKSVVAADDASASRQSDSSPSPDQANSVQDPKISKVVHRILHDIDKRKRNVVVTGLPEDPGRDDCSEFLKLCETHLSSKPYVVRCERLGRIVDSRPRRLLVRLSSDTSATELLRSAPLLRRTPDTSVNNVYINPDLTPTEAKLAFEARQRRRQRHAQPRTAAITTVPTTETGIVTHDVIDTNMTADQPSAHPLATNTVDPAFSAVAVTATNTSPSEARLACEHQQQQRSKQNNNPSSANQTEGEGQPSQLASAGITAGQPLNSRDSFRTS